MISCVILGVLFVLRVKPVVATCNLTYSSKLSAAIPAGSHQLADRKKPIDNSTIPVPAIVGGEPLDANEYPWFGRTTIRFSNGAGFSCGATLIHTDLVVSAAHCLINYLSHNPHLGWNIEFNLGATQYDGSDGDVFEVELALYPADYDNATATTSNDIIVYKLKISTDIIPLPWNTDPLLPSDNASVRIIGFGLTTASGQRSATLLKADVEVISHEECTVYYGSNVRDNLLCAQLSGKGSCQGDSGGPIFKQDGVFYGITSYGDTCGETPVAYTRTSSFIDLIEFAICNHSIFPPASCNVATTGPITLLTNMPTTSPTVTDIPREVVGESCGLFGLSVFCPLTFGGIIGRFLKAIFGL